MTEELWLISIRFIIVSVIGRYKFNYFELIRYFPSLNRRIIVTNGRWFLFCILLIELATRSIIFSIRHTVGYEKPPEAEMFAISSATG